MKKKLSFSLLILFGLLALLLLTPLSITESFRLQFSSFLMPVAKWISWGTSSKEAKFEGRIKELELENSRLRERLSLPKNSQRVLSAQVILRSHASWQSSLWLNIGSDTAHFPLKNAPVLQGDVVVGVIDEVKPTQSRVRLLSDPHLNPYVRVVRNGLYLAKGEMNGATKSNFRRPGNLLKGSGFNYDFPDHEGEARDLRSDIIKPDDILVTTGFDGLFPKGLKVARVTKVNPLKEGDYYYDIEAESLSGSLNKLEILQIIPPIS